MWIAFPVATGMSRDWALADFQEAAFVEDAGERIADGGVELVTGHGFGGGTGDADEVGVGDGALLRVEPGELDRFRNVGIEDHGGGGGGIPKLCGKFGSHWGGVLDRPNPKLFPDSLGSVRGGRRTGSGGCPKRRR